MQPETIEHIMASKAQEQATKQELVAPHEWASMLNAPENESEEPAVSVPGVVSEEANELDAADELWERLSSTRWIKDPPNDIYNHTTVANRPK